MATGRSDQTVAKSACSLTNPYPAGHSTMPPGSLSWARRAAPATSSASSRSRTCGAGYTRPPTQLYQLLDKAARLQTAAPDVPIIPLLVCRRSHATTGKMAKQLGFFVLDTEVQPIVWPEDDDPRPAARSPRGTRGTTYCPLVLAETPPLLCQDSSADSAMRCPTWHSARLTPGGRWVQNSAPSTRRFELAPMADGRNPLVEELREAALDLGVEGGW